MNLLLKQDNVNWHEPRKRTVLQHFHRCKAPVFSLIMPKIACTTQNRKPESKNNKPLASQKHDLATEQPTRPMDRHYNWEGSVAEVVRLWSSKERYTQILSYLATTAHRYRVPNPTACHQANSKQLAEVACFYKLFSTAKLLLCGFGDLTTTLPFQVSLH